MTTLLFVRHAEPDDDARGLCYGALDVPLSARGRQQAGELARALGGTALTAVYASPRVRAIDTARPLAEALGISVHVERALQELDFGEFEGLSYDELAATRPELYRRWMTEPTTVRFPGGESYTDLRRRAVAFLDEILRRHRGECVAVVSHGGVLRAILAHCLSIPDTLIFRIAQDHAAVSVVRWLEDTPIVRLLNAPAAAAAEETIRP